MNDAQLSALVGRPVVDGRAGTRRIFNHRWDDPATFAHSGRFPRARSTALTGGRLNEDVPVALNRLVVEYDHVLICGPVFPHEVAGFSGGTKYLFPGIAAPEIIHFTHWLGALITSYEVIGTIDTPVRAVINRAASLLRRRSRCWRSSSRTTASPVCSAATCTRPGGRRRRCPRGVTSCGSTSRTIACWP